ncbi:EFR1 family ferrodoxin [Sporosalibacterium faouarense]|uniref:EFR1 family ferrodoxin n=1 Tax=Sporosalibacterium faouarense TaxID=516123 RepID=UPI00192A6EA2|nr:EFR1 family ferrodoxin [Sporosalibacterium faouarense]
MMNILILYFSGTGNTEFVARYIKQKFKSDNTEVTISPIESFKKETISHYDILFFGFPVYACDVPQFIKNYLQDVPVTKTKAVFVFCTKAFYTGLAMQNALKIFCERGYIGLGYTDVNMPGSDGLAFLKKDSRAVRKIVNKDFSNLKEIDEMIKISKSLIEGFEKSNIKQCNTNENPTITKYLASKLLESVFHIVEEKMKRKFWANESCTRCLKCEKICPARNIKVNKEGVKFGESCYLCMRCLHQCPKEAIQIGKKTIGKYRWKGPVQDYNPLKIMRDRKTNINIKQRMKDKI